MIPYSTLNSPFGPFSIYPKALLLPGSAPMVSISGGQDSIFLAWTVFHFQNERQLAPIWLYYNHLWHTEGFFHGLHSLRLAFVFGWPVLYVLPFHSIDDEDSAWRFRRQLRGRLGSFYETNEVLLGHTRTDQMESFLFSLLRCSLRQGSFLREQQFFPPPSTEADVFETTPSSLFALERLRLNWASPQAFSSACMTIRTHSVF